MNYLYCILVIYLIPLIAFIIYRLSFNKYDKEDNNKELSGFEVSRKILDNNNLEDIYIIEKRGIFTDIYDSKQDVIRLSTPTFHNETIYSLSLSSYIASKMVLFKKNNKAVKFKVLIDNFISILTIFLYIIFLIALLTESSSTYQIVFYLLLFIIIYNILTIPIENIIIKHSYEELNKNKYLNKTNKESYYIHYTKGIKSRIISI